MNGAESLVRTLLASGVNTCFANPGTSEMHFVAALDRVPGMRCVLCLFEGVATGAADGYGRMAEKPAITLLHGGPGLGNGLANLHNARREPTVLILGGSPIRATMVADAQRIASATGAKLAAAQFNARVERGRGRHPIARLPYGIDQAMAVMAGAKHIVLVGTMPPVAPFAY